MNHAPGSMANDTLVSPLVVDSRLRVEFNATKDITPGEKIVWDYGVRGVRGIRSEPLALQNLANSETMLIDIHGCLKQFCAEN